MDFVEETSTMPARRPAKSDAPRTTKPKADPSKRCGLCGKRTKLVKTDCCGQWICDDEAKYRVFSYARNSCHRNHRRYTLCGFHDTEGHEGDWQTCQECHEGFETELYVYFGTNDYNFEKLKDPPAFEPTHCTGCGTVINLATDGYSMGANGIHCQACSASLFRPSR